MAGDSYSRIEAVRKTCEILTILANAKEPISGNEVAVRVQMPVGTVMCHLATLDKRGYAEQNNGEWSLSIRPALLWVRGSVGKFTPKEGKTYKTLNSVEKAIDILEFLGSYGVSNTQTIATAVRLSNSNTVSHLETLVDAGFVMEMAAHYKLGMRLSVLWARVLSSLESRRERLNKEIEQITIKEAA